jgi:CheY-like chemotaxis protein
VNTIKICFVDVPSPVDSAIKAVVELLNGNVEYIDDPYVADLVIAENATALTQYYTKDGCYLLIGHHPSKKRQPENVHVVPCTSSAFFTSLMELLSKEYPERSSQKKFEIQQHITRGKEFKILVVEDTPIHQYSTQLITGSDVMIARGYDEAMEMLRCNQYDIVLTDLEMPASKKIVDPVLGELIPYGLLLYAEAARQGAKYVAVVTDLNHHTDPIANAFDYFCQEPIKVENALVMFMHAPMIHFDGEYSKDWRAALLRLLDKAKYKNHSSIDEMESVE